MRRKTLALAAVLAAIASVAFATTAQASKPPTKANPKVTYILKGTLSTFAAASTAANGSVTINVTHSNFHARALVGRQLTFGVSLKTPTTLMGGTILNGARGIVKFRAPLKVSNTNLMAALTATAPMTTTQIIAH